MKLITSLIGIAGLSFATLAVAQEQQTASPAPEEKPSTTVEQATAPSPETTTTAKARSPGGEPETSGCSESAFLACYCAVKKHERRSNAEEQRKQMGSILWGSR